MKRNLTINGKVVPFSDKSWAEYQELVTYQEYAWKKGEKGQKDTDRPKLTLSDLRLKRDLSSEWNRVNGKANAEKWVDIDTYLINEAVKAGNDLKKIEAMMSAKNRKGVLALLPDECQAEFKRLANLEPKKLWTLYELKAWKARHDLTNLESTLTEGMTKVVMVGTSIYRKARVLGRSVEMESRMIELEEKLLDIEHHEAMAPINKRLEEVNARLSALLNKKVKA